MEDLEEIGIVVYNHLVDDNVFQGTQFRILYLTTKPEELFKTLTSRHTQLLLARVTGPENLIIEFVSDLHIRYPWMAIVLLVDPFMPLGYLKKLYRIKVNGLLSYPPEKSELLEALAQVVLNKRYVSPTLHNVEVERYTKTLSIQQIEIVRLVHKGLSISQMAKHLGISKKTVESHKDILYKKLNIHSNEELIEYGKSISIL